MAARFKAIAQKWLLASVLVLPVLAYGVGYFDEPSSVFRNFQNIGSRKILYAVLGRVAERLEQPSVDQRGNVMRLTVQHPARLLRREPQRQLPQK